MESLCGLPDKQASGRHGYSGQLVKHYKFCSYTHHIYQDFVRHVYAYFVPEGGGDPNDPTSRGQSLPRNPNIQVRNILDSYVPVYNASGKEYIYVHLCSSSLTYHLRVGDLVQYIERSEPLKKESKSDISQSLGMFKSKYKHHNTYLWYIL